MQPVQDILCKVTTIGLHPNSKGFIAKYTNRTGALSRMQELSAHVPVAGPLAAPAVSCTA